MTREDLLEILNDSDVVCEACERDPRSDASASSDGPALLALSHDAQAYGAKRLKLSRAECAQTIYPDSTTAYRVRTTTYPPAAFYYAHRDCRTDGR